MANTYTSLLYHVVFSTKNRERWINQNVEERVWAYLGGTARIHEMVAYQVGGVEGPCSHGPWNAVVTQREQGGAVAQGSFLEVV
jgi:hypothetical protein